MEFIKKNLSNILFFGFVIFLFTPAGLPVRALLIKGVTYVTTRVFDMEIDKEDRVQLSTYDWELANRQGEKLNFEQFKGKVVLVNFWATWCPPCIAEMPSYQELYDDYKEKMVFVFLASDEVKRVETFLKKNKYTLPVYYSVSSVPSELKSGSLPTTFLIDKNGAIVVDKTGAADWNSGKVRDMIDKLINE